MPRRKITADIPNAADLPEITGQQMEFVRHIVSGKTASDAYRLAYTADMEPNSIWGAASRLRSDPKVAAWINAARLAGFSKVAVTYEQHLQELDEMKVLCIQSGNMGAAMDAVKSKGKLAGLYIDRVQEVPHDPADTLRDIAQHQPDLAAQLAAAHGIPWDSTKEQTKH